MALHPDTDPDFDSETTQERPQPSTFRDRHALKVLGAIMAAMFALVIAVQVGC